MSNIKFTDLTETTEPLEMNKNTLPMPTDDNYFSPEMSRLYSGSSQIKQFIQCEAQAMAQLRGEYQFKTSEDMLVGSYVHAWSEGVLEKFISEHPEIMASSGKNKGGLKEKFQKADEIIDVLKNDKNIYSIITQSEKEFIFTGEIFGLPIKIKVDLLNKKQGYFADLKIMKSISELSWSEELRRKVNFILAWRYDWQMAIYTEIIKQNLGTYHIPHIIAASKEDVPDKELIVFATEEEDSIKNFVESTLEELKPHILRIKDLKEGNAEPIGCGECDYCRSIKQVTEPIYWLDL